MTDPLPLLFVAGYLVVALALGIVAGRRSQKTVTSFVAGDRAFGPVVMYFVMGATIFSAYALLGTPQRVVSKGSERSERTLLYLRRRCRYIVSKASKFNLAIF